MQVRHIPFDLQGEPTARPACTCTAPSACLAHPCLAWRQALHQAAPADIVLLGPNTLVGLAKGDNKGTYDPVALVKKLVPAYVQLLEQLKGLGVPEVGPDPGCLEQGCALVERSAITATTAATAKALLPLCCSSGCCGLHACTPEPFSGLEPAGRQELLSMVRKRLAHCPELHLLADGLLT